LEKNRGKIEETDIYISEFYANHKKIFGRVLVLYGLLTFIWTFEIYLTFLSIGAVGISLLSCFLIVTLGSLAFILPGLPGNLGIYELTYLSVFALLGINIELGAALVIIRRILNLFWAGLGLIPMLKLKKEEKKISPG
jgi:uncharacterized protein (TIRG00374 family)